MTQTFKTWTPSVLADAKVLVGHHELLWAWTLREVRVRYKQTWLGAAWAMLQPLAFTIIFSLVFSYVVPVPTNGVPYPLFSYAAMLPWTFLATSIGFGIPSLVNNMNLVTKIYFPREILPLAAILAAGVDFGVAALVFIGMLIWYQSPIYSTIVLLPFLLLIQFTLSCGIVLLGSAAMVFFRDLRFIVPLLIQLWLYASPVIYPTRLVPEQFLGLYRLNPMVGLLDGYRDILLYGRAPDAQAIAMAALVAIALCVFGYAWFKRVEADFADQI